MIRIVAILVVCLCSLLPAAAQTFSREEMGRLFLTPQQRLDLDRRRSSNQAAAAATIEDIVTVNGLVTRSSGKSTTWINNAPMDDLALPRTGVRVPVQQSPEDKPVPLKVGETLDRTKDEKRDGLQGGSISIKRHSR